MRKGIKAAWDGFWTAWTALTTLPAPVPFRPDIGRAPPFFVGIALVRAGLLGGTARVCVEVIPDRPWIWALTVVVGEILLTGAIHLDGWADTWDALLGHRRREDILRILQDPHLGTWGVAALFIVLTARLAFTTSLPPPDFVSAWTLAPVGGVTAVLWHMACLRYLRGPEGLAYGLDRSRRRVLVGLGLGVGTLTWMSAHWVGVRAWVLVAGVALVGTVWSGYVARRLGGYTGDTLGAAHEWGVLATLAAWVGLAGRTPVRP